MVGAAQIAVPLPNFPGSGLVQYVPPTPVTSPPVVIYVHPPADGQFKTLAGIVGGLGGLLAGAAALFGALNGSKTHTVVIEKPINVVITTPTSAIAATPHRPANASHIEWSFKNDHPNIIELRFYSKNRPGAWPGFDSVYVLNDRVSRPVSLACTTGEQICYGAWVQGTPEIYWGQGASGNAWCANCCIVCQSSVTLSTSLVP